MSRSPRLVCMRHISASWKSNDRKPRESWKLSVCARQSALAWMNAGKQGQPLKLRLHDTPPLLPEGPAAFPAVPIKAGSRKLQKQKWQSKKLLLSLLACNRSGNCSGYECTVQASVASLILFAFRSSSLLNRVVSLARTTTLTGTRVCSLPAEYWILDELLKLPLEQRSLQRIGNCLPAAGYSRRTARRTKPTGTGACMQNR